MLRREIGRTCKPRYENIAGGVQGQIQTGIVAAATEKSAENQRGSVGGYPGYKSVSELVPAGESGVVCAFQGKVTGERIARDHGVAGCRDSHRQAIFDVRSAEVSTCIQSVAVRIENSQITVQATVETVVK